MDYGVEKKSRPFLNKERRIFLFLFFMQHFFFLMFNNNTQKLAE